MLNKLSFNLMNELNESDTETYEIKKKVYTEKTYLEEGCENKKEEAAPVEDKKDKEDRLASLRAQLEKDGEQLAADEKEAIEKEIAEIENDLEGKEILNEKPLEESEEGTVAYDDIVSGDDIFFRNSDGLALLIHYANNYPEPEDYDEGYITGWNKGEDPEYDKEQDEKFRKAKEASENRDVWEVLEVNEETCQPNGTTYGYLYGQDELMDFLKEVRKVNKIERLEEDQIEDARQDSIEKGLLSEDSIENERDLAKYIANNYKDITGVEVKEVFNDTEEGKEEPIFNQKVVDETSPAIEKFVKEFNEKNGTDYDFQNEDLLDLIDEELTKIKVTLGESEKLDESKVYRDIEDPSTYIVLDDSGKLEKTSAGEIVDFGQVCGFTKVKNTTYIIVKDDDSKIYAYDVDNGTRFPIYI